MQISLQVEFRKLANLAMDCEFVKVIANLARWFANLAIGCEFGKVVCEVGKVVCEVGKAANFAS